MALVPTVGQQRPVVLVTKLHVVPIELAEANKAIAAWHRHHKPAVGHRFSLGCVNTHNVLVGVAIVGRPVARLAGHPTQVLEVIRVATDGTPNACSALYGAAARAARAMGYNKIQTYILDTELGTSLRAAGWVDEGVAGGGQWRHTDGKPRRTDQPTNKKRRYALNIADHARPVIPAAITNNDAQLGLFA